MGDTSSKIIAVLYYGGFILAVVGFLSVIYRSFIDFQTPTMEIIVTGIGYVSYWFGGQLKKKK